MKYLPLAILVCVLAGQANAALVYQATLQDNLATSNVVAAPGSDGQLFGGATPTTAGISELAGPGGSYTRALHFDGSSNRIDIGTDANFPAGSDVRTICFWFNADAFSTDGTDNLCQYASGGTGATFNITAEDGAVSIGFSGHRPITPKTALSTGSWYHVAIVVPSGATTTGDVKIYIDGVDQSLTDEAGSSQTLNTATADVTLARDGGTGYYDGYMADFRIYDSDESANLSTIMADGQDATGDPNPLTPTIPGGTPDPLKRILGQLAPRTIPLSQVRYLPHELTLAP